MNSLGQKLEFPLGVMLCQHPRRFRRHSREKSLSLDSHAQTLLGSFHLKRKKRNTSLEIFGCRDCFNYFLSKILLNINRSD